MRRSTWTVLVCSIALQLFTATNADAWWEFVAALSGPKLQGPHFDGRFYCFMEKRDDEDLRRLERYAPRTSAAADEVNLQSRQQATNVSEARKETIPGVTFPCLIRSNKDPNYRRLFSIDAGFRYHWDDNFGPANGNKVHFFSLTPVFTFYPIERPTRDILDLSAGVGLYWFKSGAFDAFNGYLYDIRVDLHVPTVVRRMSKWTTFIPAWRFGMLTFPSGFDENAFADTENGFRSKLMPDWEKTTYVGIFFDLESLSR